MFPDAWQYPSFEEILEFRNGDKVRVKRTKEIGKVLSCNYALPLRFGVKIGHCERWYTANELYLLKTDTPYDVMADYVKIVSK